VDKSSVGGIVLAVCGILLGLILEGGNLGQVLQPTAAMIVFGGTIGAVMLQFPLSTVLAAFRSLARVFFERLRRCEATRGDESALANKPALGVAAAGGSGGGTVSCLDQMNRLFGHLRAATWDLVPVTRKTRTYKIEAIRGAAQAMAQAMQTK
jgi:hypothetical protein